MQPRAEDRPPLPVVFIGSSVHGLPIARQVARLIEPFAFPLLWDTGEVFRLTGGAFERLVNVIPRVDAALTVLTPDDRLSQLRDNVWSEQRPAPRDNLVLEIGLWLGALGRERVVFLEPTQPRLCTPSDLAGVVSVRYPADDANAGGSWDTVVRQLRRWLCGEEFLKDTRPIVAWPTPRRGVAEMLTSGRGEAQHSMLLLGNTMAQVMDENRAPLETWLKADLRRRIGMLFLNPHSPHAIGRDRPLLPRGAREAGLAAFRQAIDRPLHAHCVPLLYEGPYRYSLSGLDLAPQKRGQASAVHVTHSTHLHGIEGGFSHSLPYHRGAKAFESFADDALWLWKSAYANPPGHGLAIAACWEPGSGPPIGQTEAALADAARRLVQLCGGGEFYLNPASQWHFTFCSLRRTGLAWGGPFSLSAGSPVGHLPAAFVEYAARSCEQLSAALYTAGVRELVPDMTHLKLTKEGHLIAHGPPNELAGALEGFLASRAAELGRLGLDATPGGPFMPKHLQFWPHVSVGMAFHNNAGLPEPLTFNGDGPSAELSHSLAWRSLRFHVVHYAYRTFRRNVGSVAIPLSGPPVSRAELIRGLGIG